MSGSRSRRPHKQETSTIYLFFVRLYLFAFLLLFSTACADAPPAAPPPTPTTSESAAPPEAPSPEASEAGTSADAMAAARERLRDALDRYRKLADAGGWTTVPEGDLVEPGDTAIDQVGALRERLAATEELGDAAPQGPVYDAALAAALARFQQRHGLAVDSLLGGNTRAALNVPAARRVAQIEAALDHWDSLPDFPTGPEARYVLVNVPEYRLRAFDSGREALEMGVVVGAAYDGRATPLFHDEMEHVIFRPYWNVPPSIARDELVPQGTAALRDKNFEIVSSYDPDATVYDMTAANLDRVARGSLRIRQRGGTSNALGLVKFIFPNQYAVYLHDTPADQLFDEATRAFSHGCIRVERPAELGAWVLGPQGWDEPRVRDAMTSGERQKVVLDEKIPVYIVYLLVFADDSGAVHFLEDIYDEYAEV